ncbi:related to Pheromone-regulated membrane protein 10 [Zygosaccharomyces bailii]|nr:related to Pheromone-regulated membrane protein 10 [Zygosaccharomyces bailii]
MPFYDPRRSGDSGSRRKGLFVSRRRSDDSRSRSRPVPNHISDVELDSDSDLETGGSQYPQNQSQTQLQYANASEPYGAGADAGTDRSPEQGSSLPTFKKRSGRRHNEDIEKDAVNTIRDTSGAYEEESYASDDASLDAHYQQERARLGNASETASANSYASWGGSREGKNVRFDTEPRKDDNGEVESGSAGSEESKSGVNVEDQEGSETSSSNNENKFDHFKQFFHRSSSQRESSDRGGRGMSNMKGDDDEDDDEGGGFLSRVIHNFNQVSSGLTPGLGGADQRGDNKNDEENVGGQGDAEGNDVPMVDFTSAAQNIVQNYSNLPIDSAHVHHQHRDASASEGTTMYSSSDSPGPDNSFVAAPMDDMDFNQAGSDDDTDSDYDPFVGTTAYVPPPQQVRGGVLGSLLKMYQDQDDGEYSDATSTYSEGLSGLSMEEPQKAARPLLDPTLSMAGKASRIPHAAGSLLHASTANTFKKIPHLAGKQGGKNSSDPSGSNPELPTFKNSRPKRKNKRRLPKFKRKMAAEAKITVHIADLLQRHRFILRMCKGLMLYGAPTHRLEEYMIMTSRVLEIDGQFLYLPGCMIVSFGDATTRTSEVQLIRCAQGLNLWKLHQVHSVYKQVVHDCMSAAEGNLHMDKILQDPNLFPSWVCVLLYGFCSAMVTPYAFGGDWVNLAITFFIGICVGSLQFIVAARSSMYSNVFEITSSIVVSFVGRAFGSIGHSKICFGAVTQGSLALILPGYIILCGALELQSRNLVAGSVRMFYAIIYSLFLSFGITLGAVLFGWMYKHATNETSCPYPISPWFRFLFVPAFTIGISLINQAHWTQLPVMTVISCTGYVVTYWAGKHFQNSTEFTAALAAFVIGIMGNLYSRLWKGLAVSAMLPAIFVQVPSGVASQSSLLSGLQSANEIVQPNGTTTTTSASSSDLSGSLSFGITMIQVSIGITVGLFASSLIIYPFGKKKTGLFSL